MLNFFIKQMQPHSCSSISPSLRSVSPFSTVIVNKHFLMSTPSPQSNKRKKISPEEEEQPDNSSGLAVGTYQANTPRSSDSNVLELTSGTTTHDDNMVQQVADALVEAASLYEEQDKKALLKGDYYDELVRVERGGHWLPTIDQLGDACNIAQRSVGKLKVLAFPNTGQVFLRQVASGHTHGEVVAEVVREFSNAALAYSYPPQAFVSTGTDGIYGSNIFSAPDLTVRSLGRADGQPTRNSEFGPIFFAEAEHGNRSLPELIRHLGMLLVNFPNLNGILGIKGEEDDNGNKFNALILIEWRDTLADGARHPHVTRLVDFGPHPYSEQKKSNANDALVLPLPYPAGTLAQSGVHGAGAATPLPEWTRFGSGMDGDNPATIRISPTLLFAGAHSTGNNSAVIDIPETALEANINLAHLVLKYSN
jgi:hypothetical protein